MATLHRRAPLWLLAAFSAAGYVVLQQWMPLIPHYQNNPLPDVRTFSPSLLAGLGYGLLLVLLFAAWWLAFRRVRASSRPLSLGWILLGAVVVSLPLLLTFPINATDVYRYVIRGRVGSVYGENPFETPPSAFRDGDPFAALAGEWEDATSPYGPLWELLATAVTSLTGDNLLLGLLAFKLLALATHLTIAVLLWALLADRAPPLRTALTLLWAWQPALLLMFVVDAHNDVVMLVWLVAGLWLQRRGWPIAGFLLMVLAPLTKPIGLLPLPFIWLALLRALPAGAVRMRFALATVLGALGLTALAFVPFGSPLPLVQRLLAEAGGGAGFSPATLVLLVGVQVALPLSFTAVANGAMILFGLVGVWLLWRVWRGRSPLWAGGSVLLAYVWQALNFRIWYTTWPLALWLLDEEGVGKNGRFSRYLRASLWFLLTAQLSVVIYGHIRVYLLGGSHFLAHVIGVPFVFVLPWLLALWPVPRAR